MSQPTVQSIQHLYKNMLQTARTFSSYNFREYFMRKTHITFRNLQAETDPARISALYKQAEQEHAVLKRTAMVNQIYGGWKLVVEQQQPVHERSDN